MGEQIYRVGNPVKRVSSKRPSNYVGAFGLIGPGQSRVVTDEQAATLDKEEFDIMEVDDSPFDIELTDIAETRPAKKAKTRK